MGLFADRPEITELASVARAVRADAESAAGEEDSPAFARLKCSISPSNHYEPESSSQQEAVSAFSQNPQSFRTVRTMALRTKLVLLFFRVIDEIQFLAFTRIIRSIGHQDCIGPGVFAL
jgi:hypothetical protein